MNPQPAQTVKYSPEFTKGLIGMYEEVKSQRDELLAELKELVGFVEQYCRNTPDLQGYLDSSSELVSRVEGSNARKGDA